MVVLGQWHPVSKGTTSGCNVGRQHTEARVSNKIAEAYEAIELWPIYYMKLRLLLKRFFKLEENTLERGRGLLR
jgi:hypothetical protein